MQKYENQPPSTMTHWMQCLIEPNADTMLEIVSLESSLTVAKCLDLPLISQIKKEIPEKTLLKAVRQIVMNTAKTFKFSENMDLGQATILAADLLDYFRNESLEDIVQMFKMARQGELGSGKGRLDHDVVFNVFVPAYLDKKVEAREKQLQKEKEGHSKPAEEMSAYAQQKFAELAEMLSVNKIYEPEKPVVNHHQIWLNHLKNSVKTLSVPELKTELEKAKNSDQSIFSEAVKIYDEEIKNRK